MELPTMLNLAGVAILAGGILGQLHIAWRKIYARRALIEQLSRDEAFQSAYTRIKALRAQKADTQCYRKALEEMQSLVAGHVAAFPLPDQQLLREALNQPSSLGRLRYLQKLLQDVKLHRPEEDRGLKSPSARQ